VNRLLWLYELPTLRLGLLVVGVFLIFSLGVLWLTRPWARRHCKGYNDLASYYIAAVSVFYAVLVGLIAVATWESYTEVEEVVSNEAVALADLYRGLEGYPPPLRTEVREMLRRYTHHVIEEEWPAQRRGVEPTAHNRVMTEVVHRMAAFEPATEGQQVLHAECLRELSSFLTYRSRRLQAVDSGLPGVMWLVVLLGGAITIGMTCLLWTDNLQVHSLLTASLAMVIGLVIFLMFSLDRPLWGRVSVSSEDFQEVLTTVMGETG